MMRHSEHLENEEMKTDDKELFEEIIKALSAHFGAVYTLSHVSDKYSESRKIIIEYDVKKKR